MIEELLIRDATEDDIPFFFNSTLHHYKHSSPHPKLIPDHLYYQNHQVLMARMLERKGHVLKFAALRDEPDVVFGFLWGIRHIGRRLVITPDCRRGPNRQGNPRHATSVAPLRLLRRTPPRLAPHPIALATRKKQRW